MIYSLLNLGFVNPILIAAGLTIIAGHGCVEVAKLLDMKKVPVVWLSHLSEAERRAYVIADN